MMLHTQDLKTVIEERLEKNRQRKLDLIKNVKNYETSVQEVTRRVTDMLKQMELSNVREMKKNVRKELKELDKAITLDEACLTNIKSTLQRDVALIPKHSNAMKNVQPAVKAQDNSCNHAVDSYNQQMKNLQEAIFIPHNDTQSSPYVERATENAPSVPGILKHKENKQSKNFTIPSKKRVRHKLILHGNIAVKFDGDEMQPMSVGFMVVKLQGMKLVVMSDMHNYCIKCCYIKRSVEHNEMVQDSNTHLPGQVPQDLPNDRSKLVLNGCPGGLTQTCSDVMAVVITDKKLITSFGLVPHLEVDRHIRTQKEYGGISFFNDVFLVAAPWSQPSSVDILDLRGHVLKCFSFGPSGEPYFDVPWFVTATAEGHIVVSDTYDKNVTCLSQDGDLVFSFKPDYSATSPRDTAVDVRGNVYICDSERNKVMIFSSTGLYQSCILTEEDGLEEPWLITLDEDCQLYIKEAGKDIKVFR